MRWLVLLLLASCCAGAQKLVFAPLLPGITQALSLTDDQLVKINGENSDYGQWSQQKYLRVNTVLAEISDESAKSPLDPHALGARYAELEVIRREIEDRGKQTVAKNNTVLTDAQRSKLKDLEEALNLSPIGAEALLLHLLPPQQPVCSVLARALLGLPTDVVPTDCGAGLPTQSSRVPYPAGEQIRRYLSLTTSQTQQLNAQNADYDRWLQVKQERISSVEAEIAVETARNPLDPAALGVRYVELEVIRREIASREKQLTVEAAAILTDTQKAKLKTLQEAYELEPTGREARAIGLLPQVCTGSPSVSNTIPASRVYAMPSQACSAIPALLSFSPVP